MVNSKVHNITILQNGIICLQLISSASSSLTATYFIVGLFSLGLHEMGKNVFDNYGECCDIDIMDTDTWIFITARRMIKQCQIRIFFIPSPSGKML